MLDEEAIATQPLPSAIASQNSIHNSIRETEKSFDTLELRRETIFLALKLSTLP